MQARDYIEIILSVLGGIGFLSLGFGYTYSQLREGSNKYKLDTIGLLKEDVTTLRNEVMELTKKVEALTHEIADKDKKLADALAILQGRDPAMNDFMVAMTSYITDNKPFIETIKMQVIPVVAKLDKYLDGIVIK